jgi:predicted cupin superfamily sugar epimerase
MVMSLITQSEASVERAEYAKLAKGESTMHEAIDSQALIARLQLKPHPEGGYFRETYRADHRVLREASNEARSASTAIYYLLCDGAHSAWHRIRSDEVWHFYAGDPVDVHVLDANGALLTHRLGNALVHEDAVFQAVVKAGDWFAAECRDASGAALVGCTVAPGFEFIEFELAAPGELQARFPQHRELIARLA